MNRLTKKNNGTGSWTQIGDKYLPAHNIKHKQCVNKLGQLEDIEEELGMELCTLFDIISGKQKICIEEELFKNTIWGKYWEYVKCFICKSFDYNFIYCDCWDEENFQGRTHTEVIPIKDYGKTWALTREELENEKTKII